MKMIERVRLIEEIGAADGRRGVAKWVRGWRRLRWLQRAVDTMPELLHVVFDPIHCEELDYHAVRARVGIDVKEVELAVYRARWDEMWSALFSGIF